MSAPERHTAGACRCKKEARPTICPQHGFLPAKPRKSPSRERGRIVAREGRELDLSGVEKPTKVFTLGEWEGQRVQVIADTMCAGHDLQPVDHYGQPTEYLMCLNCLGIAVKPGEDAGA